MRKALILMVLAAAATLCLSTGRVAEKIDVKTWLSEPGVKLVAVDFYATWCGPCNDPRHTAVWKRLQKKYNDRGFRLAVVSVMPQAGSGSCTTPPMTPDYYVCDRDGVIQETWDCPDLPQAFLWDWQGNLLVERASNPEVVEAAVEKYFSRELRMAVNDPMDSAGRPLSGALGGRLKAMVTAKLQEQAKFDVALTPQEMASSLKTQKKWGESAHFEQQCKMGQPLDPNTHVNIKVTRDQGKTYLSVSLQSVEKGCVLAAPEVEVKGENWELAVAQVVSRVLSVLIDPKEIRKRSGSGVGRGATPVKPVEQSGPQVSGGEWDEGPAGGPSATKGAVRAASARLIIKATPETAVVTVVDPKKRRDQGGAIWERDDLTPGEYWVQVEASGYETQEFTLKLEVDDIQSRKVNLLTLGVLEVKGTPEKSKVEITGPGGFSITRGLPVTVAGAARGTYRVKVSKGGYEPEEFSVSVEPGRTETVQVALKRPGALEISGTPQGAKVLVTGPDGYREEGGLPMTIEGAWRGTYKIAVSREGYATMVKEAEVQPEGRVAVTVKLEKKGTIGLSADGESWTDPATRLMWRRESPSQTYTWEAAQRYCDGLIAGGYDDWRLPDIDELRSLVVSCPAVQAGGYCKVSKDCLASSNECRNSLCDGCAMLQGPNNGCYWPKELRGVCNLYWSSSTMQGDPNTPWALIFSLGYIGIINKDGSYPVRCVRKEENADPQPSD